MFFFLYKYAPFLNLIVFIFPDAVIDDGDDEDCDDDADFTIQVIHLIKCFSP